MATLKATTINGNLTTTGNAKSRWNINRRWKDKRVYFGDISEGTLN